MSSVSQSASASAPHSDHVLHVSSAGTGRLPGASVCPAKGVIGVLGTVHAVKHACNVYTGLRNYE
jgi:hypothetical protein